jgi:hypothetical protein
MAGQGTTRGFIMQTRRRHRFRSLGGRLAAAVVLAFHGVTPAAAAAAALGALRAVVDG